MTVSGNGREPATVEDMIRDIHAVVMELAPIARAMVDNPATRWKRRRMTAAAAAGPEQTREDT